jgi:hypothetical protein
MAGIERFSTEIFPPLPLVRERVAANLEEAQLLRRLMRVLEDAAELRHRERLDAQARPQAAEA